MRVEFLSPEASGWHAFVRCEEHDFYHAAVVRRVLREGRRRRAMCAPYRRRYSTCPAAADSAAPRWRSARREFTGTVIPDRCLPERRSLPSSQMLWLPRRKNSPNSESCRCSCAATRSSARRCQLNTEQSSITAARCRSISRFRSRNCGDGPPAPTATRSAGPPAQGTSSFSMKISGISARSPGFTAKPWRG